MEEKAINKWWKRWGTRGNISGNPIEHLVFILMGYALGISYITQKEVVIHPQNPILGYALIASIVVLLIFDIWNIIKWIQMRNNGKRHI